jgi:hypothetical protein
LRLKLSLDLPLSAEGGCLLPILGSINLVPEVANASTRSRIKYTIQSQYCKYIIYYMSFLISPFKPSILYHSLPGIVSPSQPQAEPTRQAEDIMTEDEIIAEFNRLIPSSQKPRHPSISEFRSRLAGEDV